MPLQPVQFSFPPPRYSAIQQAFRDAASAGLTEAFLSPFKALALRREVAASGARATAEAVGTAKGDIQTGAVETVTDPADLSALRQAGKAPKYTMDGKDYYVPADVADAKAALLPVDPQAQAYITGLAKRIGMPLPTGPDKQPLPITRRGLQQLGPELGEGIQAAEYSLHAQEFQTNKLQGLLAGLQPPPVDAFKNRGVKVIDPTTGQPTGQVRPLTFEEQWTAFHASNMQFLLNTPIVQGNAEMKRYFQQHLLDAQRLQQNLVYTTNIGPDYELANREIGNLMAVKELNNPALFNQLGTMAYRAALAGQLKDPLGNLLMVRGPQDLTTAVSYLQGNQPLLEALYYQQYYQDPDMLANARRLGLAVPNNGNTLQYLQDLYRANGFPNAVIDGAAPHTTLGSQGQTPPPPARDTTPKAVAGNNPVASLQEAQQILGGGPVISAPELGFVGPASQQLMYAAAFPKIKADTTAFRTMSDSLERVFSGDYATVLTSFRQMADDPKLPATVREGMKAQLDQLEHLPVAKRKAFVNALKWQARSALQAAREAAIGSSTPAPQAQK